jgi:hypothetical protein
MRWFCEFASLDRVEHVDHVANGVRVTPIGARVVA